MSERELDVVVFGATGVTGRLVAAYLAERAAQGELRWAAAARDTGKAEQTLAAIGVRAPQTLAADVGDPASLAAMASRTRVVLNLVGPYTLYGRPVIEACVGAGAHYADLTGEIPFARTIIEQFDEPARAAGVKVVQVCGFEALPPDLLVARAAELARERYGEALATVDVEARFRPPGGRPHPSDAISGGTLQSLAVVAGDRDAALIVDPAALIFDAQLAGAVRSASPIALAPRTGADGAVIAPMTPAPFINPAVIQRSAALRAAQEGRRLEPFRYREGIALGGSGATLPLRFAVAGGLTATQVALSGVARASPTVRGRFAGVLGRLAPSSGFGPDAARSERWRWSMSVRAQTVAGNAVAVGVEADGHPGYLSTARLLGEAGMLLSEPGSSPDRSGCLTPAAALGTAHLERFEHARAHFAEIQ